MPPFYPFYIIASRKGRASSAILGHCKKFRIRKAILNALWFWEISLSSLLSALNREPSCKSPTHSSYSHATSDSCSMMLMMSVSSFHQNHDWPDATRDSTRDQSSLILTFWPLRSTHKDCVLFLTDLFFFFFLCDTCYVLDNIYFCAFTYWTCKRLLWPISRHLQGTRRRPMDSRIGRQRGPSPARRVGAGPQAMQGMEECQSYLAFTFSQNHSVARWLHFCEIEFPQLRSIELGVPTPTLFFLIYVTPFPSSVLRASWATDRRESLVRVSTRLCNDPTRVCRWIEGHRHAINATCTPNQTTRYSSYFFTLLHNNSVHWVAR